MRGQVQGIDNSSACICVHLRFRARGTISGFPLSESQSQLLLSRHETDLSAILESFESVFFLNETIYNHGV
jgi:hypothetical protein